MATQKDEKKAKVKRPSALKRDIQNAKRKLINKSFKNRVRSAVRDLEETISQKDSGKIQEKLNEVFSVMDKGVKRGVFKQNKANRTKSRLTARAFASA